MTQGSLIFASVEKERTPGGPKPKQPQNHHLLLPETCILEVAKFENSWGGGGGRALCSSKEPSTPNLGSQNTHAKTQTRTPKPRKPGTSAS